MTRVLSSAALLADLCGCSVVLGPFDQCKVDSDCQKIDSTDKLTCVRNVCVEPCTQQLGNVGQSGTILFGAILPFTTSSGAADARGPVRRDAIDLALTEINQRQGIGGRTFGVIVCDSYNDPPTAQKEADFLMSKGATAIISAASGETIAAATDTVPQGALLISVSATSPEIATLPASPNGVRLVWRTAPSDVLQAKVIASVLSSDTPAWSKLAAIYSNDVYGQDLYTEFSKDYLGTKSSYPFSPGGDVTSAVSQADAYQPSAVLVIAVSNDPKSILDAANATTHLSQLRGKPWFFTDGAKNQTLISSLANIGLVEAPTGTTNGARGTAAAAPAGTLYDNFRSSFMAAFPSDGDPSGFSYVANSYDAFYCLALASAWALGSKGSGTVTGQSLGEGMTHLSAGTPFDLSPDQFTPARAALQGGSDINITGVSGPLDFDPTTGEAPASIEVWTIDSSGQIQTLTVVPPP